MVKHIKLSMGIILFIAICLILLPFKSCVYGKSVTPGTTFIIPDDIKPLGSWADYEKEDRSDWSASNQKKINAIWKQQGKPTDENNWAYIYVESEGQNRYLVAISEDMCNTGDYLDITLEDGSVIPCISGDAKSRNDGGYFTSDGFCWGDINGSGQCKVLEIMLKDYDSIPSSDFFKKYSQVKSILNGGSMFEYDTPVGANGTYIGVGGTITTTSGNDTESDTFAGALGSLFRQIWVSIATFFENEQNDRDDGTVFYIVAGEGSTTDSSTDSWNGTYSQEAWIAAAKEWCQIMLDDGNWTYSNSSNKKSYLKARASNRRSNCALMVTHALQYYGALDTNQGFWCDNSGNFHWRSSDTKSTIYSIANVYSYRGKNKYTTDIDLEPGDIVAYYGHVNIYLGLNSSGTKTWLDGGKKMTNTGKVNGTYTGFVKTTNKISHKVAYVIRLK